MGYKRFVPENWLLRAQREQLGFEPYEVATKAGISLEQYQKFENSERNLSSSSFRIVHSVLTVLDLDTSAFNKGEYLFKALPVDDPLQKILDKI